MKQYKLPKVWLNDRQYYMDERTNEFVLVTDKSQKEKFNNINPDVLVNLLMSKGANRSFDIKL